LKVRRSQWFEVAAKRLRAREATTLRWQTALGP
jgi:hypothetical protein